MFHLREVSLEGARAPVHPVVSIAGIRLPVQTHPLHTYNMRNTTGVHNAKAEECTTPRIGSRNIKKFGGGGLPRSYRCCNTWLPCNPPTPRGCTLALHTPRKAGLTNGKTQGTKHAIIISVAPWAIKTDRQAHYSKPTTLIIAWQLLSTTEPQLSRIPPPYNRTLFLSHIPNFVQDSSSSH